jgi:hypothetical protein
MTRGDGSLTACLEEKITDGVVHAMIAAAWIVAFVLSSTFWFWLIDSRSPNMHIDVPNIVPETYNSLEMCLSLLVAIYYNLHSLATYSRILRHSSQASHADLATVAQPASSCGMNSIGSGGTRTAHAAAKSEPVTEKRKPSFADQIEQQQRKDQPRRREFKALYLTAVIAGTYVTMGLPRNIAIAMQLIRRFTVTGGS